VKAVNMVETEVKKANGTKSHGKKLDMKNLRKNKVSAQIQHKMFKDNTTLWEKCGYIDAANLSCGRPDCK